MAHRLSNALLPSPQRRMRLNSSHSGQNSSDEDDEHSASYYATTLSTSQVRRAEDLPDASRANRRPPEYAPPVLIPTKSHIACIAVHGNRIVTGHGNKLKLHQTTGTEIEETVHYLSTEHEKKELKLSALAFRPEHTQDDHGRYLWCGTKEGTIVEFDLSESSVTICRSNIHTAPVILLERVGDQMISLDESGKICIWLAKSEDRSIQCASLREAPVTQRIDLDRYACAFLVGEQLWVATAAESTSTSSKQLVPRLRMYQPFSEDKPFNAVSRPCSIPELMGGGQIGPVSCGAVIPARQDVVYVGHQTGHISVWSRSTYTCLSVQRLTSAVTAMTGVGQHLWAGDRLGAMHVFDVSSTPWQVTKTWEAHHAAVAVIRVDPSATKLGRLPVLSSSVEGQVCLWDGLLASDWLLQELEDREAEYSSYRNLNVLHFSYNIDANSPEDFQGQDFPSLVTVFANAEPPEVIIFGLQELVSLEDTKVVAKSFLFGGARRGKGKGVELGDRVSHQYRLWIDHFSEAIRKHAPVTYTMTLTDNLVGLFTCVFVRDRELGNVKDARIASIKTGFGGRMGNKGAIAASFTVDDTSIALVNCHLAAGQRKVQHRNADLVDILDCVPFGPRSGRVSEAYAGGGDGSMILDHRVVVLSGDLNYRINLSREQCFELIANRNYSGLLAKDQLYAEMRQNPAFRLRHFHEAPITFLPTYKYKTFTNEWDPSEKQRVPSYCDRILWHCRAEGTVLCSEYKRLEFLPSDHRPIQARLTIRVKRSDQAKRAVIVRQLQQQWSAIQEQLLLVAGDYYQVD